MNKVRASTRDAHSPEVISAKSNFSENESYRLCVPVTDRKTLKLSNKDNPSRLRPVVIISNSHFVRARCCERHVRFRSREDVMNVMKL